tara:strand:+ start:399 stop:827 length:429 start_codon:yes stop_codon:yes gene_type:complete
MNLVKIILLVLILVFANFKNLYADNHDTMEEAEEDVPLNDPFAGNEGQAASGESNTLSEIGTRSVLYDYKLVGIISGSLQSYASLVDAGGQVITLSLFEELSEGLKLIDLNRHQAVFQESEGKYLIINFNNKIVEKDDYAKL